MTIKQYIETLARFSGGDATLEELEDAVADRLNELRTTPDVTEEQRLLSTIELMVEETREGFREPLDIYMAVIQALDSHFLLPSTQPASDTTEELSLPIELRPTAQSTDAGELRDMREALAGVA